MHEVLYELLVVLQRVRSIWICLICVGRLVLLLQLRALEVVNAYRPQRS